MRMPLRLFLGCLLPLAVALACFAEQTVKIAGAEQNNLKASTTSTDFRWQLALEPQGNDDLSGVQIHVDPFAAPDSTQVPVNATLDGKPLAQSFAIKKTDRPLLELKAQLPIEGEYKTQISIFSGNWSSTTLTVTRVRTATAVAIEAVPTVRMTSSAGYALIRFNIRETAGRKTVIYPPVLISFGLKDGDKALSQAQYLATLPRLVQPTAPPTQVTSPAGQEGKQGHEQAGAIPAADGSIPPPTNCRTIKEKAPDFTLCPQETREYVIDVPGLTHPGEYTGTVRVSSEDTKPVEQAITVYVKDGWWWAAIFIFLGVLASWWIRHYTKESRPRLQSLERIYEFEERLRKYGPDAGPVQETEKRVIDGLGERLIQLEQTVNRGNGTSVSSALDEVNHRVTLLPDWMTEGRKLQAVTPSDIVKDLFTKWTDLADNYFLLSGAADGDAKATLTTIHAGVPTAVKNNLLQRITDLHTRAKEWGDAYPVVKDDINTNVLSVLAQAETAAKNDQLQAAADQLKAASAAYVRALAASLDAVMQDTPLGFQADDWNRIKATMHTRMEAVRNERDANTAVQLFEGTYRDYLNKVITALDQQAASEIGQVENVVRLTDDQKKLLKDQLGDTRNRLTTARGKIPDGNLAAAEQIYRDAVKTVQEVWTETHDQAKMSVRQIVASFARLFSTTPEIVSLRSVENVPTAAQKEISKSEWVQQKVQKYDLLLNLGVLIIATIFGLQVLWAGDAVWGGVKSYCMAVLWGLGLQQVAGSTFEGLPALVKKMTE